MPIPTQKRNSKLLACGRRNRGFIMSDLHIIGSVPTLISLDGVIVPTINFLRYEWQPDNEVVQNL